MGAAALAVGTSAQAQDAPPPAAVAEQRHVIGKWAVRTEPLNPDGSVARTANGLFLRCGSATECLERSAR